MTRVAPLLPCLLPLVSCVGANVDRAGLYDSLDQGPPIMLIDADVEALRSLQPSTSGPLRIGVAQPTIHPATDHAARDDVAWSRSERDLIEDWGAQLRAQGLIEELVILPGLLTDERETRRKDSHLVQLRRAAARHRVDAVLVVRALTDVDTGANLVALLDLTLVGAFLFDGHEAAAATVLEGALFDVRSEYLYATGIGEGEALVRDSLADIDPDDAIREARLGALQDLAQRLAASARGGPAR